MLHSLWAEQSAHIEFPDTERIVAVMVTADALFVTPWNKNYVQTSGYATWFTAGDAIRIAHYDVIDDVITRKL